jgi:hypothetical protein
LTPTGQIVPCARHNCHVVTKLTTQEVFQAD